MQRGFSQAFGRACRTQFSKTARFGQKQSTTTTTASRFSSSTTRTAQTEATTTSTSQSSRTTTSNNQRSSSSRTQNNTQNNKTTGGSSQEGQQTYTKTVGGYVGSQTGRALMSKFGSRSFGSLALASADLYFLRNFTQSNTDDA